MGGLRPDRQDAAPAPVIVDYWHTPFMQCCEAQSIGLPQGTPASHAGAHTAPRHVPSAQTCEPQSEFAPQGLMSLHLAAMAAHGGGWQVPPMHWREPQSMLPPHAAPSEQSGAHDGGWHRPAEQLCERQSAFAPHGIMALQEGEHPGAWQVPVMHWPEAQSMLPLQV